MATPPDPQGEINFQEPSGVIASTPRRTMKFYRVHEPELETLSMAHGLMVIFFSAGSAFLGFGLDLAKDVAMAEGDLSAEGKVMASIIQPACFYIAAAFYLAGLWAAWKRRSSIQRIKRESGEVDSFLDQCIKRWHQIRSNPTAKTDTQSPPSTSQRTPP